MLTKMFLTNFLSFRDRTEFDFTASKYSILSTSNVYNNEALKGALFIGPNASGKSNALEGIVFIIELIKGDGALFENLRCTFANTPHTTTEYEFLFSGKKIKYIISFNIRTKTLYEKLTIDDTDVLSRDGNYGMVKLGETLIEDDKLDNETLFLRTASFNTGRFPQEPVLRELMDYLFNSYCIDGCNQPALLGRTIRKYAEENGVDRINQFLEDFNYDFSIEYASEAEGEGLKAIVSDGRKNVFFKRKSFPIPNSFFSESQGNKVFADLLPHIIRVIEAPGMLVFDEFGNSLHNKLTEKIIKYFMKNTNKSQIFITSHHTNLISNSVFRPDQINLITFEGHEGSKVKRVSQYSPREAQNMEKMYLGGMFEGLPKYEEI